MKIAFNILCWLASAYFFFAFNCVAGFPPKNLLEHGVFIYVILFSFFLLLPFARSFKIANIFEYTSRIDEIKTEVKDLKRETRELLTLQNSLISNVSQNVSNNVRIEIPSLTSAHVAEQELSSAENAVGTNNQVRNVNENIAQFIEGCGGDQDLALMKLRREFEKELRRILDKEISFSENRTSRQYLGLLSLWRRFLVVYPDRADMEGAFRYFVDVGNAATHGQVVPTANAEEAISIGLRVLSLLKGIAPLS